MSVALNVVGLSAFKAAINKWHKHAENLVTAAAVGLGKAILDRVTLTSPQYSGSFAANWKMSYGAPDTSYEIDPLGTKWQGSAAFQRGSRPAIDYAKGRGTLKLAGYKLGQTIYVSNSTKSANEINKKGFNASMLTNLAWRIEEGKIKFRPVNEGADHVGAKAVWFVRNRYERIGPLELDTLRRYV